MQVKIKLLSDEAIVPSYQTEGAAGFDFHSTVNQTLLPGERALFKTGLAMEIPPGYELQVRPRSGLALKQGVTVLNSPGTVDSDYRGEIGVIVINHSPNQVLDVKKGDKIAQGVFNKIKQASFDVVEDLTETERGAGGFGSTGV